MTPVLGRVAFFCAVFSVQCCINALGNISRDTIFLRSYAASSLSSLTLLLSITTAFFLTRVNQWMTSLAEQQQAARSVKRVFAGMGVVYGVIPAGLGLGLAVMATVSLVMPRLARMTSVAIYMWLELATQLLSAQFWDLCAKAFDVSQSKKYFGFISFGSTFGTLLASLVVLPALQRHELPTEFNLVASAALLLLEAVVLFLTADLFAAGSNGSTQGQHTATEARASNQVTTAEDGSSNTVTKKSSAAAVFSDIQKRTYLMHICFFELLATTMRVLIDNTTLTVLSRQDEQEVKASLSRINSFQSLLMIPMQIASGPFFTRFGVMYGIALLPISVFVFGAATSSSRAIFPLVCSRALYNAVSLAMFNPARELLWLPFSASERSRFKSFVAGPFRSIARMIGAVSSIALTTGVVMRTLGSSFTSAVMMVAGFAGIVGAMAARKSYAAEFYASLKKGCLDLSSSLVDFTPDQLSLVKETLISGAQNQVNYVLSSISDSHVPLVSQELRDLFYKKNDHNEQITPHHTKLRLLNLHTMTRRRFIMQSQESLFAPDMESSPEGIFNAMDLMMIIKEKSHYMARQLRVAAILACGYEKFNADTDNCVTVLKQVMQSPDEDKSIVVCAAVALLRQSDWMDEEANVVLHRMIHEETDLASRVVCLNIVGRELPEMLGDGYLVYLLHHSSPQIVRAAVECCSTCARSSRMLIPPLLKHLTNSTLRLQIVAAVKWFEPSAIWTTLTQYVDSALRLSSRDPQELHDAPYDRREALAGAIKVLEAGDFPFNDKLDMLVHIIEVLMVDTGGQNDATPYNDTLFRLFGGDSSIDELVVDALLALIKSADEKTIRAHSSTLSRLHLVLDGKIRVAYEMRHVLRLFHKICPRTATNIEETSPLLLQHVEHSLKDSTRILLKLLSTGFPKQFDVSVILEGLESEANQVLSAIKEVLENLLPSSYKTRVLPLFFTNVGAAKITSKIETDIVEQFNNKTGVEILLDTMRSKEQHSELSCLALQYFLHIAVDHSAFVDDSNKTAFENEVLPLLLQNAMAEELLVETFHSRRQILPYESLAKLENCEPPLISKIAISNCLRVTSLFENVCSIAILRVLAHHFVPIKMEKGNTFVKEGNLAATMYVIAEGTVQLHKEHRVLAEVGHGTCVGQAALLRENLDDGSHVASATALTDCILLSVARSDLDALVRNVPQVSRGMLNAVASSLRWLYFEPLNTIAQSGSLPRRERKSSVAWGVVNSITDGAESMLKKTKSMSSSLKAAMMLDRTSKSFLYTMSRSRTSSALISRPLSGKRLRNNSYQTLAAHFQPNRLELLPSRGLLSPSDGSDYSNFEKSIHLKGSHLMRHLDDDKVSLVAQLTKVLAMDPNEVLFDDGAPAHHVFVVVDGTISITRSIDGLASTTQVLQPGECFGEESFVESTTTHGKAVSVGRATIFQISTKDLIDLSELHMDLMHVILAWLSYKLARATETMVAPLLSPSSSSRQFNDMWDTSEDQPTITNRGHKCRSESD